MYPIFRFKKSLVAFVTLVVFVPLVVRSKNHSKTFGFLFDLIREIRDGSFFLKQRRGRLAGPIEPGGENGPHQENADHA